MNNAIIVTIYDRTAEQHALSAVTLESALLQDIPVDVYIIDNGSTAALTKAWLPTLSQCHVLSYEDNQSPVKLANQMMKMLFEMGHEHILGLPNDVICPSNLYRKLLERPEWIVTPGMHGTNPPAIVPEVTRVHGDVHLSAGMIRKAAYDALIAQDGYFFDEGYFMYASDCDLKIRLAQAKIPTAQTDILCWHYGGASHRLAIGAQAVYHQADLDREYFAQKWGFPIESQNYADYIAMLG